MKVNPYDLRWIRIDKWDLKEPWGKLLPLRFRHAQRLMEETREAYSLALTILDIKLRNTRYNIDIMSWGKLEIKERPIIP
jgi:hypothetical protein